MIKEVIFDCFGVLTQDGWLAFLQKYSNDQIKSELHDLNHQADRGMMTYQQLLSAICILTGSPESEAHQTITTSLHPNEEVFDIVRALKGKYKLGVISNVGSKLETYLPKQYVDLFDVITLSSEVALLKPEPQIYLEHLRKSGSQPEQAVFIDDRRPNVDGALAVGMEAIWYQNPEQLRTDLSKLDVKLD